VAHSFGCLATVHSARGESEKIAGALLVAPADPTKFNLDLHVAGKPLSFPTIVIGSSNDPWMCSERAAFWAKQWGSDFVNAGSLGHINAESELGDWLFGLAQLQRLVVLSSSNTGAWRLKHAAAYPAAEQQRC
jgi:predicted alpha/beta hydrolase family esterase